MRVTMSQAQQYIKKGYPAKLLDDYPNDSKILLPVEVKTTSRVKGGLVYNVLIGKKPNPFSRKGRKKQPSEPRLMRTFTVRPADLTR